MIDEQDKRILLAVRYLWGDEGITTQLINLSDHLTQRGWDVGILSGIDDRRIQKSDNLQRLVSDTEFYSVPLPQQPAPARTVGSLLNALPEIVDAVQSFSPSIIHQHSLSIAPYFFLARPLIDAPIVSTCHVELEPDRTGIQFSGTVNGVFGNFLGDHFVAKSDSLRQDLMNHLNVSDDDITKVCYGVNDDQFRPPTPQERTAARRSFGLSDEDRVVCLVGRLDPVKGHEVLFEALEILRRAEFPVHAICPGTGGFAEDIKEEATERGLSDLTIFPGYIDVREAYRDVYWASDVKILPSYREGCPLVISHAMLCGLPTIRTPTSGVREQTDDGRNGFVVPFDAPEELAGRIRYLFEHPDERHRMGQEARDTAKDRFTLDRSIDQTEALYASLIEA